MQYAEGQVEDTGFRLNDAYFLPSLPDVVERTMYVRHKAQVRAGVRAAVAGAGPQQPRARLAELLAPLDALPGPVPAGQTAVYADYALHGVLGNYTYSAQNRYRRG